MAPDVWVVWFETRIRCCCSSSSAAWIGERLSADRKRDCARLAKTSDLAYPRSLGGIRRLPIQIALEDRDSRLGVRHGEHHPLDVEQVIRIAGGGANLGEKRA